MAYDMAAKFSLEFTLLKQVNYYCHFFLRCIYLYFFVIGRQMYICFSAANWQVEHGTLPFH